MIKLKAFLRDAWRAILLLFFMVMMGICEYAAWTYESSYAAIMVQVFAVIFIVLAVAFLIEAIIANKKRKSVF